MVVWEDKDDEEEGYDCFTFNAENAVLSYIMKTLMLSSCLDPMNQ